MIVYQGIVTLDYFSATELLIVDIPDIRALKREDLRFCFGLIVNATESRQVRKLLLDTSKSVVDLENEIYKDVVSDFLVELSQTSITKTARISATWAGNSLFESSGSTEQPQRITFRMFPTQAAATDWLLEQV